MDGPEIITLKQAKARGLLYYYTGKPCKHGHIDWRIVSARACVTCHETRGAEHSRKFRETHTEKVKATWQRYYARNRAAVIERVHRRIRSLPVPRWYGELDDLVLEEARDLARMRAESTDMLWHIDHMIPIKARRARGLHCAENIQLIPALLNRRKKNKMMLTRRNEWLKYLRSVRIARARVLVRGKLWLRG